MLHATSLSRRLRSGFKLHRLLIAVLTAIAVIVTAATVVSVRLDASPPPAGAPPMQIPAAGKAQVMSLGVMNDRVFRARIAQWWTERFGAYGTARRTP